MSVRTHSFLYRILLATMLIFTPFSKLLFTFVVVVITKCDFASAHPQPHSGYRTDSPHRNRTILDSPLLRRTNACITGWAGAVWDNSPTGGWNSVSAYLNVPKAVSTHVSALVWVGIDGTLSGCNNAFFQLGISATLLDDVAHYYVAAQWSSDETYQFTDFPLNFGNIVVLTVTAHSATSGTATIKNISKGITASHTFNSQHKLLFASAEWVVQPFSTEGKIEFGEVGFYNAQATKFDGTAVNGAGADLYDIGGAAAVSADVYGGITVSF